MGQADSRLGISTMPVYILRSATPADIRRSDARGCVCESRLLESGSGNSVLIHICVCPKSAAAPVEDDASPNELCREIPKVEAKLELLKKQQEIMHIYPARKEAHKTGPFVFGHKS